MSKLLKLGLSLGVTFSFSLANAIQNGDYQCVAETTGVPIPDYISAPSTVNLNFIMAELLGGGLQVTHNDFDLPEILKEKIIKGKEWISGKFTFNENHKIKNKVKIYAIEESQSYQSYTGKHAFKWSKGLNLYEGDGIVKLDIEYATFFGEGLAERDKFKLEYICK